MADWVDSLSDAEVSALYKYKQGGVDSLSDDEVKLMYPHKEKLNIATPAQAPQQGFWSGAKGTAAAGADLLAMLPKAGAQVMLGVGGKIANPSMDLQTHLDSAGQALEETFPSFGKGMDKNLGYTVPMYLPEKWSEGVAAVAKGASLGNRDVEGALNIGGNFLPIPFAGKAGKAAGNIIKKVDPGLRESKGKITGPDLSAAHSELTAPKVDTPIIEPLVDTKPSLLKSKEAYEAALREQKLAKESAFSPETEALRAEEAAQGQQRIKELGEAFEGFDQQGRQSAAEKALAERKATLEAQVKKAIEDNPRPTQPMLDDIARIQDEIAKTKAAAENARIAADSERMGKATQPEMFEGLDHGYGPNPYDVGGPAHWVKDENGIPMRADLSMEARNLENPLQRNLWGDELGQKHHQEAPSSLTQAIDNMPDLPWRSERDVGLDLFRPAARKALMKKQGGMINPEVFKDTFEKVKQLANGITLKAKGTGDNLTITATKDGKHVGGAVYGKTNKFDAPEHSDLYGAMLGSKVKGTATEMYKFANELGNDVVPSGKLTEGGKALWDSLESKGIATDRKIPFNFKKQGGGIRLDFSKKKEHGTLSKIPGLKQSLGDILPDQRTVEQFLKEEASTNDVSQNALQKLANNFTKGGVYQAIKTGNPLIKRVVDKVLEANNTARGQVAYWVHDKLAPAAMDLSKTEKADVWAMQVLAEQKKTPLTPEFLAKHGFNEKQIKWVTTHGDVMKAMLDKMNEAMDSMGKEHVNPATAYLASRASGDFRRLIYKEVNGKQEPVSILGANTRRRLNSDVEKLKAMHPEWIIGEERFFGGGKRGGTAEGFTQMLELIGKDNPDVKLLAEHVNELLTKDAFDYMGAKTHTMAKKGIEGMTGRKVFEDAITNAEEGMKAQISYAEKMIEWAEMSKAVREIQPLLKEGNGLNMPAAKEWSHSYLQQALGNNPSKVGRAIDNAFAEAWKSMGVGPTLVGQAPALAKKAINGILLGFINIPFQAMNLLQPFKSQPEMMSFLKGRGLEKSFDAGTGYRYLADAIKTAWMDVDGKQLPAYKAEALKYAKDKHVYSSDLFDASSRVSRDFGHYWDKATQFGASAIEMRSRQITYLSYVDLLHENGLTKADGLYEAAHRLTDIQMNNYNHVEAPKAYMVAGGLGHAAYNLMSYKHNEYSRLSMLANEIGRSGTSKPLLANIAASIAFAGVMGTIGYSESDALVKLISDKMGKPTSITKILLDNPEIPDNLKYGMGAGAGVDLSSRLGTGPLVPQHAIDAVMPGAGKLVNIASSAYDAVTKPSEFNTKNAIREALPNSVGGLLDREWFSKPKADGNELALSRNTGKPTATRNDTDKVYKSFGFTGLNEAKQKSKNYEEGRINKVYAEKQAAAIDYATKAYNITGKVPADFATLYVKAQGDPAKFEAMLNKMVIEGAMDAHTAQLLYAASANSITSTHKLLRLVGQE